MNCGGHTISSQGYYIITPSPVCDIMHTWLFDVYLSLSVVDEPILSFQRNTFLSLKEERKLLKKQDSGDPINYRTAIDLLYHEVCFAISVSLWFILFWFLGRLQRH